MHTIRRAATTPRSGRALQPGWHCGSGNQRTWAGLAPFLQGFLDPCGESQQQACQGPSSGGLCADGPSYARCHHIQEASLAGEAHHCPEWGAAVCWGWSYTLCRLPPRFRVCTPGGWRCQEAPRSSDQVGSLLSSLALGVCYHRVNLLPVFLGLFFLLTEAFNLETLWKWQKSLCKGYCTPSP